MPYIQLEGQQFPLVAGDNAVGSGASAQIRLAGGAVEDVSAVLVVGLDGGTIVRRGGQQAVKVNGVALGAEPSPLLHGDRIEIGGRELFFGDDRKGGNTQYVPNVKLPTPGASSKPTPSKPTGVTGGRLISLVDGREYPVAMAGLVLGRDPTCDVVVSSTDVSRKHAVISVTADGYLLTDTSTNGVLVNGARITAPVRLGKGDVIVIGSDEFRFSADASAPVMAPPPPPPVPPPAPAPVSAPPSPPPSAPMRAPAAAAPPSAPVAAAPASVAPTARPVLATIEVTSSGVMNGKTFEVRSPLTHIGRGAHNDIVITDESVSDSHAKLQKRDAGWYVVDMDSTNGTYVGGKRIKGEQMLQGAPDLRFGGIKVIFRATDAEGTGAGSTRAIATLRAGDKKAAPKPPAKTPAASQTPPRGGAVDAPKGEPKTAPTEGGKPGEKPAAASKGMPIAFWILGVIALGALALYLLTTR